MVIRLEKEIEIKKEQEELELPRKWKDEIQIFWKEQIQKNPNLFNGEIWNVSQVKESNQRITILIQKTNYSHYLFDERRGIDKEYSCHSLSGGILLETLDHYYVVGEMDETTSVPSYLQVPGGNFDKKDSKDNLADITNCIQRELKEEMDIDLKDQKQVLQYEMKYIDWPEEGKPGYEIIMKGNLNMTAKQLEEHFQNYKKQLQEEKGEIEFNKIHLIPKQKALETLKKMTNPRRTYIEPLIEMESKEPIRGEER